MIAAVELVAAAAEDATVEMESMELRELTVKMVLLAPKALQEEMAMESLDPRDLPELTELTVSMELMEPTGLRVLPDRMELTD